VKRYVVDTQCLLWYLARDRRLPRKIKRTFDSAQAGHAQILVPSIVLVEAIFLLQRQRVSEEVVAELLSLPETPDAAIQVIPLDMAVVRAMQAFGPTAVPELADRIIAASAHAANTPLMTVDPEIINSGLVTVVGQ
jgi:predicted nucleic acid-binding protein